MDGAQRRFQNDQERNRQLVTGGPGSNAARSSMRPTADNRIKQLARPRTGQQAPNTGQSVAAPMPQRPSPERVVDLPGPPPQTFDETTAVLQRQVRMEKLLSSPEAQHANTVVSLRNFWNDRDIDHNRGRQVREMLQQYAPPE